MSLRTSPADLEGLPPGVPHIIRNEAAERFSFYGMKAVLAVFMLQYLHLLDGPGLPAMSEAAATEKVHMFTFWVYFTPFFGAILADVFLDKYRTIIALSLVYCAGHAALALMGVFRNSAMWLVIGLGLIALGSGGIKPWLERRKQEIGVQSTESVTVEGTGGLQRRFFSGGQTKLQGADYFWFFTWLMLGTAVAFMPYALLYRPKTYLQD